MSDLRLRSALKSLPAYVPGRNVPEAIKLSSNETPYPPLPHVLESITAAARNANRYPDTNSTELCVALANKYGVATEQVAVGCGSSALITQLFLATIDHGDEAVYAWRSFEAYPIIGAVAGATTVQVALRADRTHDLDAMADAITDRTRLLIVCNPNNPTGTATRATELKEFLRRVPEDIVVLLDEAYREYVTDPDVPDGLTLLAEHRNLVVLRTFSKAYGLAGMRVGYAIASQPALATALRQTQMPFSVTAIAQQAALASLHPQAEAQLLERVSEAISERSRLWAELTAMGYDIPPSQTNFLWFPLGERTLDWAAGCEQRGVIVRPFAGAGARVTVGSPDENDTFLAVARELRSV